MRWAQFPLLEGAGICIIGWDLIWAVISRRYGFKNGLLSVLFIGRVAGAVEMGEVVGFWHAEIWVFYFLLLFAVAKFVRDGR